MRKANEDVQYKQSISSVKIISSLSQAVKINQLENIVRNLQLLKFVTLNSFLHYQIYNCKHFGLDLLSRNIITIGAYEVSIKFLLNMQRQSLKAGFLLFKVCLIKVSN